MNDKEVRKLIEDTVNTTVLKLKAASMLKDGHRTATEKTEALLHQYPELKKVNQPYARRVVQEVDTCLATIAADPYAAVIPLYYFEGKTNAAVAAVMCCDERTARRNRKKFVEQFASRLASDEFIRELLL